MDDNSLSLSQNLVFRSNSRDRVYFSIYRKLFITLAFFFRGHTVKAVTESFRMAKDSGFKVVSHMMPNLPNVDLERDLYQFKVDALFLSLILSFLFCLFYLKEFFENPEFRPDGLKLYPTLVIRGTGKSFS